MDRDKAKQILDSWSLRAKGTEERIGYVEGWFFKEDEEAFDMAIKALSSERTGEWIDKNGWSYCSNCEKATIPQHNGCEIEPCRTPFCPWCGVGMREKGESE